MISNSFVWGDDGKAITPEDARRRREVAMAMIQQGTAGRPIQHWTQGAANVAQALLGAYDMRQADNKENAAREAAKASDAQFLGMIGGGGASPVQTASLGGAAIPAASRAVAADVSAPRPAQPLANVQPMNTGGMQDNMKTAMGEFVQAFPEMQGRITSGYRDPQRNAAVGGASGSRHLQGDAIDFSVAGLPEARQQEIASWWRQRGAGGFGYYPNKGAMHVDFGAQRAWGPNYSRTSLGDTPQWFQSFAAMPANQQAAPVAPQAATPMAEKTLGAIVRNGLANQAAQAQASPPVQVAQAAGAVPQSSPAPVAPSPVQQVAQANPQLLQAAMARMSDPYASAGSRAVAQALVQRIISQQSQDPRDIQLKDLSVQEKRLGIKKAERDLNMVEMDRITDPATGALLERPKGANQPFQPVQGTGPKAPETTTDQRELAQINKEREAAGLPALRMDEYKFQKARANATTINNDLSGGSGKQVFDAMMAQTDTARAAASGLNALREARKAVEGGGFFGAGADARLGFAKIGQLLGFEDGRIVNTETFRSAIAPQIAAMMKATVGSTQISNADREFAEKAAGGSTALDERSVKRLLDIMERGSTAVVERHLEMLDQVYPEGPEGRFGRERALMNVRIQPPPTAMPADPGNLQPAAPPQPGKVLRYNPQTGALE